MVYYPVLFGLIVGAAVAGLLGIAFSGLIIRVMQEYGPAFGFILPLIGALLGALWGWGMLT